MRVNVERQATLRFVVEVDVLEKPSQDFQVKERIDREIGLLFGSRATVRREFDKVNLWVAVDSKFDDGDLLEATVMDVVGHEPNVTIWVSDDDWADRIQRFAVDAAKRWNVDCFTNPKAVEPGLFLGFGRVAPTQKRAEKLGWKVVS